MPTKQQRFPKWEVCQARLLASQARSAYVPSCAVGEFLTERFPRLLVFWDYIFALDWLPCFGMLPFAEYVFEALESQGGRLSVSFDPVVLAEVRVGIGQKLSKMVEKDALVVSASSTGKDRVDWCSKEQWHAASFRQGSAFGSQCRSAPLKCYGAMRSGWQ
jgi:hypothetical protein